MNLAAPIRAALIAESDVTSQLQAYEGSFPVFTRRPAPSDAPPVLLFVSPDIALTDEDGISDRRNRHVRDVSIYGPNEPASEYRKVESLGYAVRELFHRNRDAIEVPGWDVVDIVASGPIPAPTDD
jgi:hypothetical protein